MPAWHYVRSKVSIDCGATWCNKGKWDSQNHQNCQTWLELRLNPFRPFLSSKFLALRPGRLPAHMWTLQRRWCACTVAYVVVMASVCFLSHDTLTSRYLDDDIRHTMTSVDIRWHFGHVWCYFDLMAMRACCKAYVPWQLLHFRIFLLSLNFGLVCTLHIFPIPTVSHPAVQSRDLLRTVQDLGSESTHPQTICKAFDFWKYASSKSWTRGNSSYGSGCPRSSDEIC